MDYKLLLKQPEYLFLKQNEHLGKNIILIGLGGSHAYGTNIEGSDIDIRGIALNKKEDILTNQNFEQFCDSSTDTTIYSLNKIITLLSNCNPNTIEMLGLKPEHYIYKTEIGEELLKNADMFLSKRAIHSFGGYAYAQLRRLDNKAARVTGQKEREQHVLNTIKNMSYSFKEKYGIEIDDAMKLYLDDSSQEDFDKEIFIDLKLSHYPLRDYNGMMNELSNVIKEYNKIGKRNEYAIEKGKLSKHMMHLVRLYNMAFDIMDKHEIITYREDDHDFLMSIRNGKFLDNNGQPIKEFFDIVDELQRKLEEKKLTTTLPDNPDFKRINNFLMKTNEKVIIGVPNVPIRESYNKEREI